MLFDGFFSFFLRYAVRYGRYQNKDDAHEVLLGKNLDDGKPHKVNVGHNKKVTTIVLDDQSRLEREERQIKTYFEKLEIDIALYVGGADDFKSLLSVKSSANFLGCLTDVEFTHKSGNQDIVIKFFEKNVADTYPSDMTKECTVETYTPFTFSSMDSSFVCPVSGLASAKKLEGSFYFRTYKKEGKLLAQINGKNKFELSYTTDSIELKITIDSSETAASITYQTGEVTTFDNGNWHQVSFTISPASVVINAGTKTGSRTPTVAFPNNFFKGDVTAGGFIGCMRDLKVNKEDCTPNKDSNIKNVEWDSCNITDFCIFSPCLHGGKCSQTGKSFTCDCTGTGYDRPKGGPVCQFCK